MEAWLAPGDLPPATLPASAEQQGLAVRPQLVAGPQPSAAILLLEVEVRAL